MARLATLAVLLLSLLAVASCRVLETTSDDQGPPNAVLLTQDDQSDAAADVTLPALPTPAGENIVLSHGAPTPMLRLPSHRSTCRLHRHLWWTRHHGLARVHPAVDVVPAELARGEDQEPREAVAEPDPDSRPDTGAEQKPFHGEEEAAKAWKVEMLRRFRHGIRFHHRHHEQDGEEHDDHEQDKDEGTNMDMLARFHHRHHLRHHHEQAKDEGPKTKLFRRFHHHHQPADDSDNEVDEEEAAKAWKVEMLRRFRHGIRFHHRHHEQQDEEEHDDHEQDKDAGTNMDLLARFHHRHHLRHHHEQDAEEEEEDGHRQDKDEGLKMKLFRRFHHHHAHDSENEVDEVEELARKLGEAIVRRSFSHGGRRHSHHHHHHGVRNWFKGLLNRF
ncbi:hypothetical protein D1007_23738 [Hordeum vulgare]|nr:hypothetical protein D1007_23738 [Hordeum vulgare]